MDELNQEDDEFMEDQDMIDTNLQDKKDTNTKEYIDDIDYE